MGERSYVSVQSESQSSVLVLMGALMFYYNQRYIKVLESFLMFFSMQNNIQLIQHRKSFIWFICSAVCYLLGNTHVQQPCYYKEAKSYKSWRDSLLLLFSLLFLNYLPYISTICKVTKASSSKSASNTAQCFSPY